MHAPPFKKRRSRVCRPETHSLKPFAHEQQPAAREHLFRSDALTVRQAHKLCELFDFHPATARVIAGLCYGGRS
jgi:hypothetical protein